MSAIGSNTELLIRRAIASHTNKRVAEAIGCDETFVSRFLSGERGLKLSDIGAALSAMGLKLVDADEVTVPAKRLASLEYLAAESLGVFK